MIEKRVSQAVLESGELRLTPSEVIALELPEHTSTLNLELEGESFSAQWAGRGRYLHGELLTERLQDYAQIGGLLRLRKVDKTYRLQLIAPGESFVESRAARGTAQYESGQALRTPTPPRRKRRQTADRVFHPDSDYDWGRGESQRVGFLTSARDELIGQLADSGFDPAELVQLRVRGEELATLDDFEELLAVDVSSVDRMPHQEAVARQVLARMQGRAVLADEVGLGKTIEAGLIIKEFVLRGLAKRILILCPAPLREQWRDEMASKFELPFDIAYRGPEVGDQDHLIMSLVLGRNQRSFLTQQNWDIVIVDEAHRVAGAGAAKTRELISGLSTASRYLLFLTATPVQNDLMELYRLVQLLRPGTFKSPSEFRRKFVTANDPRNPKDPADLRRLVSSAMVRTTRAQAGVDRVTRRAEDHPVTLGRPERELYVLCTDLLRNVMTDRSDSMRRRSLALRLSANPFSMGTTALRMAERHPDQRVARTLTEIAHHALDIRTSARETKSMKLSQDWLDKHGRVLVFTQHTDTVTALLRRYESEGIAAVPFHGSMSATQRAESIGKFKSGKSPVMVSTDAGAEGQNLQFCNCVLNYDLPWNPMRIEQRIGRVDRLTQPCDEVFVANLYARDTVDESVYRLLAEKLRMFELLFGQVTTILGELDDSKNVTFEGRVLEALFADDDDRMGQILDSLGTELVSARERASELISADSNLSSWLQTATAHRTGLTKAGATELAPDITERTRQRQSDVQAWTRSVIAELGGRILHDTGKGQGAFLTARMPAEFEEELAGRSELHLAFDRHGLEHHPDAELCAVGSPIFEELLGLLRQRGDINVSVSAPPSATDDSPFEHSAEIELVRRSFVPTGSWSGTATFRASVGETEANEHFLTVQVGEPDDAPTLPRAELEDGAALPKAFGTARSVIKAFEAAARTELGILRSDRLEELQLNRSEEAERITAGYDAELSEASGADRQRLARALEAERRRLGRAPDVRARATLLTVELAESEWHVEEIWRHRNGAEAGLTFPWDDGAPPEVVSDANGEAITTLSLCSDGHWIDARESRRCASCAEDRCDACKVGGVFEPCGWCGADTCGVCLRTTGGLCNDCFEPERDPRADRSGMRAWQLPTGERLLVSEAACIVEDVQDRTVIVPASEVDDPVRIRVRAYASSIGLPADAGLILTTIAEPDIERDDELVLACHRDVTTEIRQRDGAGTTADNGALEYLPERVEIDVISERGAKLSKLLKKLRAADPPPPTTAIEVIRRASARAVSLGSDGLIARTVAHRDDGSINVTDEVRHPLDWFAPDDERLELATAECEGITVTIERCNQALVITATEHGAATRWEVVPDHTTFEDERCWHELLERDGAPGAVLAIAIQQAELKDERDIPEPTECELASRTVHPIVRIEPTRPDSATRPAEPADRDELGLAAPIGPTHLEAPPDTLRASLLERCAQPPTRALIRGFEVVEQWRGYGTASRSVTTFDGVVPPPLLDDDHVPATDFGICRDGHFYRPGTAAHCESCDTWPCRACSPGDEPAVGACGTCGSIACHRCRTTAHDVPQAACQLCGAHGCNDCGTNPNVVACAMCGRNACASCRIEQLCVACDQLIEADAATVQQLPAELAATNARVWTSQHASGTVAVIQTANRLELAVLENGQILDWIAHVGQPSDEAYQLGLVIARKFGIQASPTAAPTRTPAPFDDPHLTLQRSAGYRALYGLTGEDPLAHTTTQRPDDKGRPIPDIIDALGGPGERPRRTRGTPTPLRSLVGTTEPDSPTLEIWWELIGDETLLTGTGLLRREFRGNDLQVATASWQPTSSEPEWAADAWNPAPVPHSVAQIKDVTVYVATFSRMVVIGVRTPGDVTWSTVRDNPAALAATALGRLGDARECDMVGAVTWPTEIQMSSIAGATVEKSSIVPRVEISRTVATRPADGTRALNAWNPTATIAAPSTTPIPPPLVPELSATFQASRYQIVSIGALVTQTVRLESGVIDEFEIELAPGEHGAFRTDAVTGQPANHGHIDREGHFVGAALLCPYCAELSCAACAAGPATCGCCGITACSTCLSNESAVLLCEACRTLARPSRSEARQHGRSISTKNMLLATDAAHTVVLERTKSGWILQSEGDVRAGVDPSLEAFLSQRYER